MRYYLVILYLCFFSPTIFAGSYGCAQSKGMAPNFICIHKDGHHRWCSLAEECQAAFTQQDDATYSNECSSVDPIIMDGFHFAVNSVYVPNSNAFDFTSDYEDCLVW